MADDALLEVEISESRRHGDDPKTVRAANAVAVALCELTKNAACACVFRFVCALRITCSNLTHTWCVGGLAPRCVLPSPASSDKRADQRLSPRVSPAPQVQVSKGGEPVREIEKRFSEVRGAPAARLHEVFVAAAFAPAALCAHSEFLRVLPLGLPVFARALASACSSRLCVRS